MMYDVKQNVPEPFHPGLVLQGAPELKAIYDEVVKCNKCGFCQAACPVYRVTGKETVVARGHYAHVREIIEGHLDLVPRLREPFFDCLLCKACTANCPPAVEIAPIMTAARAAYSRRYGRSAVQRFLLQGVLPNPRLLSAAAKLASLGKRTGLAELAGSTGALSLLHRDLPRSQGLVDKLPFRSFAERASRLNLRPVDPKRRVAYFNSCGFNYLFPEVAAATTRVLTRNGCEVQVLPNYCCGLPAYSYGDEETAKLLARKNIDLFRNAGADAIVSDCGSCSSFLKEYARLLAGDAEYAEAAHAMSARVRDINQFLVDDLELTDSMKGLQASITYHDPCHLSRYQKITSQPRALLKRVPDTTYRELPEADWCCGAGGTFNITHYDQAMEILDRKMGRVSSTGASIVATSCPSCMLQLGYGARKMGLNVKVMHVTQVLDMAYSGTVTHPPVRPH
jgi:glycolate dehydrogenase iron-sulfur subunit